MDQLIEFFLNNIIVALMRRFFDVAVPVKNTEQSTEQTDTETSRAE
jgi:hypothetical protein